jgi:hypothetical protein
MRIIPETIVCNKLDILVFLISLKVDRRGRDCMVVGFTTAYDCELVAYAYI